MRERVVWKRNSKVLLRKRRNKARNSLKSRSNNKSKSSPHQRRHLLKISLTYLKWISELVKSLMCVSILNQINFTMRRLTLEMEKLEKLHLGFKSISQSSRCKMLWLFAF